MKLKDYLAQNRISMTKFASLTGFSLPQVSRLANGKAKPSWRALDIISKATGGKVEPNDFQVG